MSKSSAWTCFRLVALQTAPDFKPSALWLLQHLLVFVQQPIKSFTHAVKSSHSADGFSSLCAVLIYQVTLLSLFVWQRHKYLLILCNRIIKCYFSKLKISLIKTNPQAFGQSVTQHVITCVCSFQSEHFKRNK